MDFVETEREVEDIVSDENPEENELLNLTDDSEQQPDHEGLNHQFVNKDTEAEDDTLAPRGKKRRILDDEEDEHQKQGTQRRRILDNEQNKQQEQGKQMTTLSGLEEADGRNVESDDKNNWSRNIPICLTEGMRRQMDAFTQNGDTIDNFWDAYPTAHTLRDNPDFEFVPPEIDGESSRIAIPWMVRTHPFPLLNFISPFLNPLEQVFKDGNYKGGTLTETYSFAKVKLSRGRMMDSFLMIFKDLSELLKDPEKARSEFGLLFGAFSLIRIRLGSDKSIAVLGLTYNKVMVHKPEHGMLFMVCNKADALREFENCLVKFGTYDPALVMHEPNDVDLRKAYEAAGILNTDDLSLALRNKQYYPEVDQMNDFMVKRIEKPLAGMINGAVKWTYGKAESAQDLTAFSKLYLKEQLVRPNKQFKAVLQPLCQIGTIWWDPEFLKRLPELNKWVYNWIFKMFDICPVVFFKMIVTMLVGHNNRQCLMLVSGDVLTGKSLLISVLQEVVGGKLFINLSKNLPYTEASGVFVDTPTDIQLQLLYSNRGIFSKDRKKYGHDKEHSLPPFWVATNTPMPLYLNEDEKDKKEKDKFLELKSRGFILTTKAKMKEKLPYSIEEIANAVVLWIMEIYRKPPTDDSVRPWYSFLDDLEEAWTVVHGRFKLTMKQQWNYEGNTLEWEKQNHYGAKTWCHALSDERHELERMGMTDGDILKMKIFILRNNLKAKFKLRLPTIL